MNNKYIANFHALLSFECIHSYLKINTKCQIIFLSKWSKKFNAPSIAVTHPHPMRKKSPLCKYWHPHYIKYVQGFYFLSFFFLSPSTSTSALPLVGKAFSHNIKPQLQVMVQHIKPIIVLDKLL